MGEKWSVMTKSSWQLSLAIFKGKKSFKQKKEIEIREIELEDKVIKIDIFLFKCYSEDFSLNKRIYSCKISCQFSMCLTFMTVYLHKLLEKARYTG